MSGPSVFKGLTRAQQDILTHWYSLPSQGDLPDRSDLDPGVLRAHLASISMIELQSEGEYRFRLVGSALRRLAGHVGRGHLISDVGGVAGETLSLGLNTVIERRVPVGGIIDRGRDQQVWLRLPLIDKDKRRILILCHDTLHVQRSARSTERTISSCISNKKRGLAA